MKRATRWPHHAQRAALVGLLAAPTDFPFLPGETTGSVSLGDTSTGRLVGGVALQESDALGVLPHQKERGLSHGTTELVGALHHAATALHDATGTKLWVGHLSRPDGGDIPWSVSHNAGRDADIAFAYRDAEGRPIDPGELIPVMGDGRTTRRGVFFDVGRTWQIVKALITYEGAQIQYLFVSRALEGRLLMHAKARGEPKAVRRRAEALLHQPGRGAARHQDHLHLRLYCARDDVLAGCINTGREHPFAKLYRRDKARFAMGLKTTLGAADPDLRRRALERVGLLGAKLLGREVLAALRDPERPVRVAAAVTLARFGEELHLDAAKAYAARVDHDERLALAEALPAVATPAAGELLGTLIDLDPKPEALIAQAGDSGLTATIPALVRRLADPEPARRGAAARALGRLTATRYVRDWSNLSGAALETQRRKWQHAWSAGSTLTRRAWLMRGFHRAGLEVGRIEPEDAWTLVTALDGPDHLAFNAREQLQLLFGREGDCASWRAYLTPRRLAFDLPPAPSGLCRTAATAGASSLQGGYTRGSGRSSR